MHYEVPIVGMHFRPPAKHLVAALPLGSPLTLVRDPENSYEQKARTSNGTAAAIKVFLPTADLPEVFWTEVEPHLAGCGSSREELLIQPPHIAFIASKGNESVLCDIANAMDGGWEATATFARDMAGNAMAKVELEEPAKADYSDDEVGVDEEA